MGLILRNRFALLLDRKEEDLPEEENTMELWSELKKEAHSKAAEVKRDVLAKKPWISDQSLQLIRKRVASRAKIDANNARAGVLQVLKCLGRKIQKAKERSSIIL